MAWFVRTTRLGMHMVYAQQGKLACGIASVIMVNNIMRMRHFDFADSILKEEDVYAAYSRASGKPYDGKVSGTSAFHLATVLNGLGIGEWEYNRVVAPGIAGALINAVGIPYGAPAIVNIHWDDQGWHGHWVVCSTIGRQWGTTALADFLDPKDAQARTLQLTRGVPVRYVTPVEHESLEAHKFYANGNAGTMGGVGPGKMLGGVIRLKSW